MAGGKRNSVGVVVACLVVLIQISSSAATSHIVGGSSGWGIPSSPSFYYTWASNQTFKVDDILVFNFKANQHTVAEVSERGYKSCTTTKIKSIATDGPANITVKAGTSYYVSTISGDCAAGLKLTVKALNDTSSATSRTTSSHTGNTTAKHHSSATNDGALSPVSFLLLATALLL